MVDRSREKAGFTLIELMIVVALIGVLAAIAIPNFMSYQARSRRSEAFVNLARIARAQKTYYAERDAYHDSVAPWPDSRPERRPRHQQADLGRRLGGTSPSSAGSPKARSIYSYEANTTAAHGCDALHALLHGDRLRRRRRGRLRVRGDVRRSPTRGRRQKACKATLFGFGTPTRPDSGAPVYNEVDVNRQTDEF